MASEQPNGTPFQALWNAIASLQQQINEIELIPGPPGPQGPQGPQGEQGPPGTSITKLTIKTDETTIPDGESRALIIACDNNGLAVSGGYYGVSNQPYFSPQANPIDEHSWQIGASVMWQSTLKGYIVCLETE